MGFYQEFPLDGLRSLYEEGNALSLIAAARILDAASQSHVDIKEDERVDLAITAAVAFGMYGNSLSSHAVCERVLSGKPVVSGSLAVILATVAPQVIGKVTPWCQERSKELEYLEQLEAYLRSGEGDRADSLRSLLTACRRQGESAFERSLLLSCELCLEHLIVLSVAAVLRTMGQRFAPDYVNRLVDAGVYLMLPPQYKAVANKPLLRSLDNALIALPTSAGKTLLGEWCLLASLQNTPGLVCYLAPYVALGRQVAASFRKHVPSDHQVHELVGGGRSEFPLSPQRNKEVVVATPRATGHHAALTARVGEVSEMHRL
jgi:hypothetical protein